MTDDAKGLVVEQVDREAAWHVRPAPYSTEADFLAWMAGIYDSIKEIQAFAKHRIEATAARDAEIKVMQGVIDRSIVRFGEQMDETVAARCRATKAEAELETCRAIISEAHNLADTGVAFTSCPDCIAIEEYLRTAPATGEAG